MSPPVMMPSYPSTSHALVQRTAGAGGRPEGPEAGPPGFGRGGAMRIASSSSRSNAFRSSFVSPGAATTTGVVGAVIVVASAMAIVPVPLPAGPVAERECPALPRAHASKAAGPGPPPPRPRARRLRPARAHPQLAARAPAPLRPEPVPHVLLHEHVRVQLRHPQPPLRGPLQAAQRRPD